VKDLAGAFFAAAICPVLVILRTTLLTTGKQRNRSAHNAPSEILRCAQDDGDLSARIIFALGFILKEGTAAVIHTVPQRKLPAISIRAKSVLTFFSTVRSERWS
jgi:hypothetical protein